MLGQCHDIPSQWLIGVRAFYNIIGRGAVYREYKYTEKYGIFDFWSFLMFYAIFDFFMVSRRPGRHFKMILRLVASFSQSISSFRATATHFIPKTINFQRSPTTKTHNPDLQKLNFREPMYCKYKIYVLQIQKYSIKAPIIFCKYIIYVLQIQKLCINAPIIYCKYTNYLL